MKRAIAFSNPDKILFPKSKISKGEVIDYYRKIAPLFIALARNHLVVMHRFPNGIEKEGFYQKQISEYFPAWIHRKTISLRKGEQQTLAIVNTADDLLYLANQAVLVFHTWLSQADALRYPDKIVFDLDPAHQDLDTMRFVAKRLKKLIEAQGLVPFIMTTGSRGYHIVVPIVPEYPFEKVRSFAKEIAQQLVRECPDLCTVEMSKAKRKNKIFVDYLRNSFGQTAVAPYSVRALEGAPIATPLSWSELARTKPQQYTIKNIFRRLSRKKDPWKDFRKSAKKIALF